MKLILLLLTCLLLAGCSQEDSYAEILENWQKEKDTADYQELQEHYSQVSANLTEVNGKYLQAEAVNEQQGKSINVLQEKCAYLENQLLLVPEPVDITVYTNVMQEMAKSRDELDTKFIALMDLWVALKMDYKELAVNFREAVGTGNFSDNQTMEYLEIIKDIRTK